MSEPEFDFRSGDLVVMHRQWTREEWATLLARKRSPDVEVLQFEDAPSYDFVYRVVLIGAGYDETGVIVTALHVEYPHDPEWTYSIPASRCMPYMP